jgi:hypothetical protein
MVNPTMLKPPVYLKESRCEIQEFQAWGLRKDLKNKMPFRKV